MRTVDHKALVEMFRVTGNRREVARAFNCSYSTVVQAIHESEGRCHCGRPIDPSSSRYCSTCIQTQRKAKARARDRKIEAGVCAFCGGQKDSDHLRLCANCRTRRQEIVARYNLTHREAKRNRRYDGNWGLVMERDKNTCQVCGETARELHHIDEDRGNHRPENLIALCHSCHLTLTRLSAHPNPLKLLGLLVPKSGTE